MTQSVAFGFITRRQAREPGAGEVIIGAEIGELVPVVIDRVDAGIVGPLEIAPKLKIVGWIGEDEVDRSRREFLERGDAIAAENLDVLLGGRNQAGRPDWTPRRAA